MKQARLFLVLLSVLLIAGCSSLYTGVVTITSVVDTTMKGWAELSVAGKTTPDIDAKVKAAHEKYRQACGVARDALKAYQAGGSQADYTAAFAAVRVAAAGILDIVTPLLTTEKASAIQSQFAKANTL